MHRNSEDRAPTDWFFLIYVTVLFFSVMFILYSLLYYSFDRTLKQKDEVLAKKLENNALQSLLNGSGINNIPGLNIVTTNSALAEAHDCGKGPIYIGESGTAKDCQRVCANSSASVINVRRDQGYIFESTSLKPGAHCIVGPRPECDLRTTIVLMTINSVVCRPKFPNLVGGKLGTKIVACNNRMINDPQNYLWDYKNNRKVNPWSTLIRSEDELLEDGSYRFRCRFNGSDTRGNQFEEHPYNRFHPIINYCANLIYRAHPDVRTIFDKETGKFRCDCGDFATTRVRNIDPLDESSQCAHASSSMRDDVKQRKILTVPYRCFTLYSPIEDVGKYLPCRNEQLTRNGSQTGKVDIMLSENEDALIEHPLYEKLVTNDGVTVLENELLKSQT